MNTTPLEKWIIDDAKLKKDYRKTLNAYQLSNIKNTIKYAKENSLFYKNLFENVSENISSLKDFSEIPFIYSKDIAENPYNFLCMPQKFVNRIVTLNT